MSKILPEPEPEEINFTNGGIPKKTGGLFNFPLSESERMVQQHRAQHRARLDNRNKANLFIEPQRDINPRIWKQQRRALRDRILMDSQDDLREALPDSSTGSIFTPLPK